MTMFDNTKLDVKVNMTGKEYLAYKESTKLKLPKLSKKTKEALPYFIMAFVGIIIIVSMINAMIPKPEVESVFSGWYKAAPALVNLSWDSIAKVTFVSFAPLIVVTISLAWVLHGFGFLIIKG